ncbi:MULTISPECIES: helix-turn-helix domain-containing protein [unclassified Nocardia]|uniref:PucR family transcriptional regulator n=1 Tax=unclassified Nocardia TaxID=2637762 RepID=UPI003439933E
MTTESLVRPERNGLDRPISPSARDIDRLTREVMAHLAESDEQCGALPGQTLVRDVKAVVRICLGWLIHCVNGHVLPTSTDRLAIAAAGCTREGIPVDTVLHAVHEGFKVGMDLIFARTGPADVVGVVTGTARVLELSKLITATVSKAYVLEHKAVAAAHQTAAQSLTSALLAGHLDSAAARESGLPIAEEYSVLAVAIPAHPDERHPRLDGQVVARRKLRRLQAALATIFGGHALSLLSVDGGTILLPSTVRTDPDLDDLVQRMSSATQVPLTVAVVTTRPDEVPAAARHAHELLDTVQQLELAPGVYRFTELALQYQLTRPGIGRDALATRLTPLNEYPDLLETLQIYIDTGLSRTRAARQLCVHPNTVDYRLRRIAHLTGCDPAEPSGLWYLRSAIVARKGHPAHRPTRSTAC